MFNVSLVLDIGGDYHSILEELLTDGSIQIEGVCGLAFGEEKIKHLLVKDAVVRRDMLENADIPVQAVRVEADVDLPEITVDVDRMTQVINNLVSNALHHTETGEVVLGARAEADGVRLFVKDTGVGIPAEDLEHVFDRFYRGDSGRKRQADGGSGLGLAIAKAIVSAHGG